MTVTSHPTKAKVRYSSPHYTGVNLVEALIRHDTHEINSFTIMAMQPITSPWRVLRSLVNTFVQS